MNCSGLQASELPSDFIPKLLRATSIESMDMSLRIVQLNLSNNQFTTIPEQISEITTLQLLNLSGNKLGKTHPAQIVRSIGQFPSSLKTFNVSKNGLSCKHVDALLQVLIDESYETSLLPSEPRGLHSFLCSENRIEELPRSLNRLSASLRELQV